MIESKVQPIANPDAPTAPAPERAIVHAAEVGKRSASTSAPSTA